MSVPMLVVALPWERKAVLRSFPAATRVAHAAAPTWEIPRPQGALRVVQTGIGQEAAGRTMRGIDSAHRGPWIVVGCAGGLDPTLRAGDVVVADAVVAGDEHWGCDELLTQTLMAAVEACGWRPRRGRVASREVPLLSLADKRREWLCSAAIAVEMEGAAVAAEAVRRGGPFALVRIVLDDAATGVRGSEGEPGVGLGELPLGLVGERLERIAAALGGLL